jgi:hypothetical protein
MIPDKYTSVQSDKKKFGTSRQAKLSKMSGKSPENFLWHHSYFILAHNQIMDEHQ